VALKFEEAQEDAVTIVRALQGHVLTSEVSLRVPILYSPSFQGLYRHGYGLAIIHDEAKEC
jgi:hypothetical protein